MVKNPHGFSKVWNHFGFYKIETKISKDFAVCFVCKQECKYSGGTSNLSNHLETHHSELCQSSASSSGTKTIQSKITSMMKQPTLKLPPATQSMFTEGIAE